MIASVTPCAHESLAEDKLLFSLLHVLKFFSHTSASCSVRFFNRRRASFPVSLARRPRVDIESYNVLVIEVLPGPVWGVSSVLEMWYLQTPFFLGIRIHHEIPSTGLILRSHYILSDLFSSLKIYFWTIFPQSSSVVDLIGQVPNLINYQLQSLHYELRPCHLKQISAG